MMLDRFVYDPNRFNLSERLIGEMFLLTYIFIFFLGESSTAIPYIWIFISIIGGIVSYFLFYSRAYSSSLGAGLALCVTVPLSLLGVPLLTVLLFFVYVFWRIQANFNGARINGWPIITVLNTVVFFTMYLLAKWIFATNRPDELLQQQLKIYLITTFLFYFIRMVTISINSRQVGNFKVRQVGKVFSLIMGIGVAVYFFVLITLKPAKLLFIKAMGLLFGGGLMFFFQAIDSILYFIGNLSEKKSEDVRTEILRFGFEEQKATSSIFENFSFSFLAVALVIIAIVLMLIKKKQQYKDRQISYFFSFKGKSEPKKEQQKMLYDYSVARDKVRKSIEQFEKEAQTYKLNRYREETIQEWFLRMGWENNENIWLIYTAVRYGFHTPSERELNNLIVGPNNIRKSYF